MTELRPPPEHAHLRWHWVKTPDGHEICEWVNSIDHWFMSRYSEPIPPSWVKSEVVYLGPCDPSSAETIARLTAALRESMDAFHLCAAQAGTPDASEGCRLIIRTAERARAAAKQALGDGT